MADLALSVLIDRTSLSLSALEVQQAGVYEVIGGMLGPGVQSWRRATATSPDMHGRALISAALDVKTATLGVRVFGTSHANLWTRVDALLDAVSQVSYTITVTVEGHVETWRCEPAEGGVGREPGLMDPFGLRSLQQEVKLQIPRDPVPVAGVL